uniref:Exo-alpha-sialidase n=1 Tax=candidate division WOR-3 bacterium TaxID=2052148 RepID=A0A7V1EI74_UNCW3
MDSHKLIKKNKYLITILFFLSMGLMVCIKEPTYPDIDRHSKLPPDIVKRTPETDLYPPILHSDAYEPPVPLGPGVNTSGAEDSPFILPDGKTLYFVFTPDVRVPVEKQLLDSVTGVWISYKIDNTWTDAERVWLQSPGKLSLDGAVAIQDTEMWFASAREGYTGVNMFIAYFVDGKWANWTYCGDRLMKEIKIGEVHIHGDDLYFHSACPGTHGGYDIWLTTRSGNNWSDPINIAAVNTPETDGWPYISSDGKELWFTRFYQGSPAIFRSVKTGNEWGPPELILSQFAGEPSLDDAGNIYFVHHF